MRSRNPTGVGECNIRNVLVVCISINVNGRGPYLSFDECFIVIVGKLIIYSCFESRAKTFS